jgi:GTP-binding protein HflX
VNDGTDDTYRAAAEDGEVELITATRRVRGTEASNVGAGRRIRLGPDEVVLEDWETDRAVLVGLVTSSTDVDDAELSLRELAALAETAGAEPVAEHLQVRDAPNPATYVGSGKVEEIAADAELHDATLIVFDDELSPAQQRNLEKAFRGRRVLDRTQLILDIFAQHATTREGKVQVELAQLRYRLPRLRGRGALLNRLGAGIGTRGPGETVLEIDRRRIQERLGRLGRELASLDRTRRTKRKSRREGALPSISLVGYTNAGKSTLLNRLTAADVLVENKLFSTLDTTVRRCSFPGGREVLLSDTVGFVRKLPHELVRAFHSTLEESAEADLLLHVVDASAADPIGQVAVVRQVLTEVGAVDVPELVVWNKADRVALDVVNRLCQREAGSVAVSAVTGIGVDGLIRRISECLDAGTVVVELVVPFARGDVVAKLHRSADVLSERHGEGGTTMLVRVPEHDLVRYEEFRVGSVTDV